jgi:hypothetical protein
LGISLNTALGKKSEHNRNKHEIDFHASKFAKKGLLGKELLGFNEKEIFSVRFPLEVKFWI